MTAITRFASILIALAVFIVLGYLKGRGSHAPPEVARTEPIDRAQAA